MTVEEKRKTPLSADLIKKMSASELCERAVDLYDLDFVERETLKALFLVRAKEVRAQTAVGSIFRAFERVVRLEAQEDRKYSGTEKRFFDERGHFLHEDAGRAMIDYFNACSIGGALHIRSNGIFTSDADKLHGALIDLCPGITKQRRVEVISFLQAYSLTPRKSITEPRYIPFRSNVYDIETGEFFDYADRDKDFTFLNRFAADYDENAPDSPLVRDLIEKVADGRREIVSLLWEITGYCLWRRNDIRGSVLLYGPSGSNGKSTLLNLLEQFIGADNASHLSLQDTTERFRLAALYGAAVNLGDDIPNGLIADTSIFKRLATGEAVTAENKGEKPFSFTSYAKLVFACNALPPASDKSSAFLSRLLIVPLNHDFSQDKDFSPELKNRKWSDEELACVCKHAVAGVKRLLKRGKFLIPADVEIALADYRASINPLVDFVDDQGGVVALSGRSTEVVYDAYRDYCSRAGHRNLMTHRTFTTEVQNLFRKDGLTKDRRRVGGRLQYCFTLSGKKTCDEGEIEPF